MIKTNKIEYLLLFLMTFVLDVMLVSPFTFAARLKDITSIRGVRENQLIGYGIVVGLKGTGDGKSEFTGKSLARMLDKLGIKLDATQVDSKNVAAVIVTGTLPAFAKAGNSLDITVSSLGDAGSLEGGTLLQTPLRAANEQIFAVAQGTISIGGQGKEAHTTVGRIPNGALIERDVSSDFSTRKMFRLTLHNPDFITAARVALTINRELSGKYATALDAGTVDLVVPFSYEGKGVELLATIEAIEVNPDSRARVVINEKTGTVIIGEKVKISKIAISHGNLSIKVTDKDTKGGDKGGGTSASGTGSAGKGGNTEEKVAVLDSGVNVGEFVQALNKLGISPKDLITLLQSIKAAGALHGELEIL